ncbi:MAG: phosphoesterase [Deltaproteobacteria bacterium]|nr:MAG: phosphoesterase [Deltaproteobacteria bacterium]
MGLTASERLRRFYEQFQPDDRVLVVIFADPDAIGCAQAVKRLLWRKVAGVTITHVNQIERPDNLAMVRLLGVSLTPYPQIRIEDYTRFVMVDSQPSHYDLLDGLAFDVILDHHPETGAAAGWLDIRPRYGANASMLVEYLRAARIKPSVKLATALYLSIKIDTCNFERKTIMEDLRAFQFVFKYANKALANRVEQTEMTVGHLDDFSRALSCRVIRKGRAFIHLGPVSNPDICVLVADFFMKVEAIHWSVVSGRVGGRLVVIFRNDGIRRNAGNCASRSFGPYGSAGGHKSLARAEILLETVADTVETDNDTALARWIISRVERYAGAR